jgi:hypothetical protein
MRRADDSLVIPRSGNVGSDEPDTTFTAPTSQPATLGMLAMGAPGLSIWRREQPMLDAY